MATHNQAGFTLVELIIAMAISGLLVGIAFYGQSELRARAQFDGTIEKVVSSVADAHSQATAAVNVSGNGDGTTAGGCTAIVGNKLLFAGATWEALDAASGAVIQMQYYTVQANTITHIRTAAAPCVFATETVNLPSALRVNPALPAATRNKNILFLRDDIGSMNVCQTTGAIAVALPSIKAGTCVAPASNATLTLTLTDAATGSYSSQIQIDASGLAQRLN